MQGWYPVEVLKGKEREKELEDGTQTKSMKNQGVESDYIWQRQRGEEKDRLWRRIIRASLWRGRRKERYERKTNRMTTSAERRDITRGNAKRQMQTTRDIFGRQGQKCYSKPKLTNVFAAAEIDAFFSANILDTFVDWHFLEETLWKMS